jgi:hypothetical protein
MTPGGFVFDIHRYVPSGIASLIKAGEAGMSAARAPRFLSSIRAALSSAGDRSAGKKVRGHQPQAVRTGEREPGDDGPAEMCDIFGLALPLRAGR